MYVCVAVCCSVLQCVAVCCSELQCVAVSCLCGSVVQCVVQCVSVCCSDIIWMNRPTYCDGSSSTMRVAVCCNELQ